MFASRFKKEGILNKSTGIDYRRFILERGGSVVSVHRLFVCKQNFKYQRYSKDAKDMLVQFLGREPNENAFLESKGLQVD
jgi:thimet oligopeptidase